MKTITLALALLCIATSANAQKQKEVILNENVDFPIVINGRQSGFITAKSGMKVHLIKQEGNMLTVTHGGVTAVIDASKASVLEHMPATVVASESQIDSESITSNQQTATNKDAELNTKQSVNSLKPAPETKSPSDNEFQISVTEQSVRVRAYGSGNIGVIFFNNSGPMDEDIKSNIQAYKQLLDGKITMFLWSYPNKSPFTRVKNAIRSFQKEPIYDGRKRIQPVKFEGIASKVISQIADKTGISTFIIVGNSLGAGIVLWDYEMLVKNVNLYFIFISPTQIFMPKVESLPELQRTALYAALESDSFVVDKEIYTWIAANQYPKTKPTREGYSSHFILGDSISHIELKDLLNEMLMQIQSTQSK